MEILVAFLDFLKLWFSFLQNTTFNDLLLESTDLKMHFKASLVAEVKASAWNAGDPGSIPGSGRSPGEGNGTPLQYSCLENPMEGGARETTVHGVAKSQT